MTAIDKLGNTAAPPRHWLGGLYEAPRSTRLRAAILDAEASIDTIRRRLATAQSDLPAGLLEHCLKDLGEARVAQSKGAYAIAYECLKRIRREQVWVMSEDERRVEFAMVAAEGSRKLIEWRSAAAGAMAGLGPDGATPTVEVLQGLMKNLDESQQNRQHKIELIQEQIMLISALLVLAVIAIGICAGLGLLEWITSGSALPSLSTSLPGAMASGFLGGLLSVAFGAIKTDLAASIQDIRSSWITTIARPFIGAAVAAPICLFLQTGFINADKITPAVLLAFCFVGGFSERWFLSQVDRIGAASK